MATKMPLNFASHPTAAQRNKQKIKKDLRPQPPLSMGVGCVVFFLFFQN